jgi:hypothetical protein
MDERSDDPGHALADALNRDCHCIAVDDAELQRTLQADLGQLGVYPQLLESHPNLFAASPVFLAREHVRQMSEVIASIEAVVRSAAYREQVLAWAPPIARQRHGPLGVFLAYDFHVGTDGPKLIEINTNAGGALLHVHLANAQRACCTEVENLVVGSIGLPGLEDALVEMFRNEWRLQRAEEELRRVAIVDEDPSNQFLHPEFLLFQQLFERHGMDARIADPREFTLRDEVLWLDGSPLDLVYNRLTDFHLESPANAALNQAYRDRHAVFTPHPHAYALYANKRNLTLLSDPDRLRDFGVEAGVIETLSAGVPHTVLVDAENAEVLWSRRRKLFFKPLTGFGSRGAYRGDKLTRRVWRSIIESDYVAQEMIPPSQRLLVIDGDSRTLKLDIRCHVYDGEIQLLASRVYQGQATNLRTEGGGLASVFTTPAGL